MRNKIFYGTIILTIGLLLGVIFQPLISGDSIYQQIKKYEYILSTAVKNYVEDVDTNELTEAAIRGMLEELDPHSVYISPEDMKSVDEEMSGSFEGIGVQFDIINDTIVIVAPIAGGPSEALGITAGDKIVTIDGEDAVGIKRSDVPKKLRGPKDTKVVVEIFRQGDDELIEFEIIRDKIPLYSVDASFMVNGTEIGVIVVNRFSATTRNELIKAARKLKKQGMNKLVLDLRGNPGGYLNQAFYMADEFLSAGDTIVFTKGRRPEFNEVFRSTGGDALEDIPLIVMVNAGSASASEIVSGSVQDLDRGLVVGTTSFGKGLVQRQYKYSDGSAFRLTISKYYTPSGRCIQRPYEDKEEYRSLVGRLELDEGNNLQHALETIRNEEGEDKIDMDSIPLYYTRSGRTVLGGGGITPDYIVKSDTITKLSRKLRIKRIFYDYVSNTLNSGKELKEEYTYFSDFYNDFQISDDMISDFRKVAEKHEIEWVEEDYQKDEEFIKTEIKATLARMMWDRSRYVQIFFTIDKQFQKAISLFPEAKRIAKIK